VLWLLFVVLVPGGFNPLLGHQSDVQVLFTNERPALSCVRFEDQASNHLLMHTRRGDRIRRIARLIRNTRVRIRQFRDKRRTVGLTPRERQQLQNTRKRRRAALRCAQTDLPSPPPRPPVAEPEPTPTPTPPSESPERIGYLTDSITHQGVSWYFDMQHRVGQFANGDYWVVPEGVEESIVITTITPWYDSIERFNGYQVSPLAVSEQSFDGRIPSFNPELLPQLPLEVSPGHSVVKTISRDPAEHQADRCGSSGSDRGCLASVSVLTVLSSPPEESEKLFRPCYLNPAAFFHPEERNEPDVGRWYSIDDLRLERLPSLPIPAGATPMSPEGISERFTLAQMSHMNPIENQYLYNNRVSSYGANRSAAITEALLSLMIEAPLEQRLPAIIDMVQGGLDLLCTFQEARYPNGQGGHGNGYLVHSAFAAAMLEDISIDSHGQIMGDLLTEILVHQAPDSAFNERTQIYFSQETGRALYGDDLKWLEPGAATKEYNYWLRISGIPQSNRLIRDPYQLIDGGDSPGGSYQSCCNSMPWKYVALIGRFIPEMRLLYNNEALFEYVDRWVEHGSWTSPDEDICAPPEGGVMTNYGVEYGPSGAPGLGECILGEGRFPLSYHGKSKNSGARSHGLGEAMWDTYRAATGPSESNL